jgi:hypothetical protein
MAIYDTPAPADPFARSRTCFESLAEDLASGRAQEMTHDQLEELIGAWGREVQRQLLVAPPGGPQTACSDATGYGCSSDSAPNSRCACLPQPTRPVGPAARPSPTASPRLPDDR